MWTDAQRDGEGRPAEYRWRPTMLIRWVPCSNEAKTRKPLKFAEVLQTRQPISAVNWAEVHCEDTWRR